MTLSINFSKDMKAVLKQKAPEYNWRVDWPADGEKWLVDVAGIPKKGPWILVEVELKRDDPVGNVVKNLAMGQTKKDQQKDRPFPSILETLLGKTGTPQVESGIYRRANVTRPGHCGAVRADTNEEVQTGKRENSRRRTAHPSRTTLGSNGAAAH